MVTLGISGLIYVFIIAIYTIFQFLVPAASLLGLKTPVILHIIPGFLLLIATIALALRAFGHIGILTLPIGFTIGLLFEVISIETGFPFGRYEYTEAFRGPWILDIVPLSIPIHWYAIALTSYLLAHLAAPAAGLSGALLRILLTGFLAVLWDLIVEPLMLSIGLWMWIDEGPYYGAPLSNFFGWFLTASTIAIIYEALFNTSKGFLSRIHKQSSWRSPQKYIPAMLIYLTLILSSSLSALSRNLYLPAYIGFTIAIATSIVFIYISRSFGTTTSFNGS